MQMFPCVHHPITISTTYFHSINTQHFRTSLKGLVMLASICQSTVLHTLRLWSSAWEAMYFPTGSHVRPLTNPVCPRRHVTISGNRYTDDERTRTMCLPPDQQSVLHSVWQGYGIEVGKKLVPWKVGQEEMCMTNWIKYFMKTFL